MNWQDYLQLFCFITLLLLLSYPFGLYIYKIATGEKIILSPIFAPIEKTIYKLCSIEKEEQQSWLKYGINWVIFSVVTLIVTYIIIRYQNIFPLNPQNFPSLSKDLAWNTAVSFLTNTNWQAYGGESTLSYFSQMVGLAPHNFISAAMGISALFAIIRGLTQEKKEGLGNFWVDLTRTCLYILLPLSFILALFYISQGIIQNFSPYTTVKTLEGATQTIAQGPAASQIAIKMLGTNGGGFFNANAAHPFENPSALVNFIQIFSAVFIPSSLVFTFGKMAKHMKHAFSIWIAMALLFVIGTVIIAHYEYLGNPLFVDKLNLSSTLNMEGKEVRLGIFSSSLFTDMTTCLSLGASAASHSSLMPLAGLVAMVNMLFNEVIFGGVGSGLYGMLLHIIIAVFIAGLMVGRTPEYLGKKIEAQEVKLSIIPLIGVSTVLLILLAIASVTTSALSSIGNPGAHGFSEMLYAYTSASQNNGSSFGSLNANTPFWNYTTSIAMLIGRYLNLLPILAIAGYMAKKKIREQTENSFPVHGGLFIALLIGIIVIIGALSYLPALALGPIIEHLQLMSGKVYTMGGK